MTEDKFYFEENQPALIERLAGLVSGVKSRQKNCTNPFTVLPSGTSTPMIDFF
jgi:hypothetical protein